MTELFIGFALGTLVGSIVWARIHKAQITVERAIAETNRNTVASLISQMQAKQEAVMNTETLTTEAADYLDEVRHEIGYAALVVDGEASEDSPFSVEWS